MPATAVVVISVAEVILAVEATLVEATWAAATLGEGGGMAAPVTLPGMVVIVLGMATIVMATITITSTMITSPITATSTIASTTASWQSESDGGPATMVMVMAGAWFCIAKPCIPEAPIGGTATTPARATTTDGFTMRLGFMA